MVSVADLVVGESDGWADVVVRLDAPAAGPVSVAYATEGRYAQPVGTGWDDYVTAEGTLEISAGETAATIRVEILDDDAVEGLETFVFQLREPRGATLGQALAIVTIIDDDAIASIPALVARDTVVDETDGSAEVVVLLGGPAGTAATGPVSVAWHTQDAGATAGADYLGASGTLELAPGDTVATIVIDLLGDTDPEPDERFEVVFTDPVGVTLPARPAIVTIAASDAPAVARPVITVADVVVGESDGWVDILVRLDAPGTDLVSMDYATEGRSANPFGTGHDDYWTAAGTLHFPPGVTARHVRVDVRDDDIQEGYESFGFQLRDARNATIGRSLGLVALIDDDTVSGMPSLVARDVAVDEAAGTAEVVVLLGGPRGVAATAPVSVAWHTEDAGATAGEDYLAASGTLVFAPGDTTRTIVLDLLDDDDPEPLERFAVVFSDPAGLDLPPRPALVTIAASDAPAVARPAVSVSDVIVGESDGWVDLVVSLDAPGTETVSVDYTTEGRTANPVGTGHDDYWTAAGTLVFPPGVTSRTVRVELVDGDWVEGFESFGLVVRDPRNAILGQHLGIVGVIDDDTISGSPTIVARAGEVDETDGTAQVVVLLGGPHGAAASSPVGVAWRTEDAGATAGQDYIAASGILELAPGETARTITIDLIDDAAPESAERFAIVLSDPSGAVLAPEPTLVTIAASDGPAVARPAVSVSDAIVGESDGWVDVVVRLDAPGTETVSVDYATEGRTAGPVGSGHDDFWSVAGTLVFPAGVTSRSVRVELIDGDWVEGFETFGFVLRDPRNAILGQSLGVVGIIDDDTLTAEPALVVRGAEVDEADGTAEVVVLLGGPRGTGSSAPVTVEWRTEDAGATAGEDYIAASGTLELAPGETARTITIDLIDDAVAEPFEGIAIVLSDAFGATLPTEPATITIAASDAPASAQPAISVSDAVVDETDGWLDMVVRLDAPSTEPVSVSYATEGGTAGPIGSGHDDYLTAAGTLIFPAGVTARSVRVEVRDDDVAEGPETATFVLREPRNATLRRATGTICIVDDEQASDEPLPCEPVTGTLAVTSATGFVQVGEGVAIGLVLDTSGSMLEDFEGDRRIDVAKRVLRQLVTEDLAPGTPVALRVFRRAARSCDTQLAVPLGPLDPGSMAETIGGLRLLRNASTPLAKSIARVRRDLADATGHRVVVIVSDGRETCGGDPVREVRRLVADGMDVTVNVVGLDLDRRSRTSLRRLATVGAGTYFDARDPEQFAAALRAATSAPYEVLDADGARVGSGTINGAPIQLPPGDYQVVIRTDPVTTLSATVSPEVDVVLEMPETPGD
ncbi:MAG: VWA domain-containing protein [Chloroflexi bacterium]|nr:VWA domain-containing protein [Chloroflexota bacterium]